MNVGPVGFVVVVDPLGLPGRLGSLRCAVVLLLMCDGTD